MNYFAVNFDDLKPLREKKQSEYVPSEECTSVNPLRNLGIC